MKSNKGLLSNFSWKFAERITAQLVSMIVSIILARILDPHDYGTIAIVMIFITIANVFVSDGLGSALIQKKDADSKDFSSVLIFNLFFSTILYFILFTIAPLIAGFYGNGYEILVPVLRVLGIRLIFSSINSVQQAYISREMMFYKFFWSTLFGTVASAVVGIYMAYHEFGVWALVAQYMCNTMVDTVFLAITIGKVPPLFFSSKRLRGLLGFGLRVLGISLLINIYEELRSLIIGKVYTSEDLAYFSKGKQFPNLVVTNVNSSISAVLFPKMSLEQDNLVKMKGTMRNSIRFSSFVMFPLLLGLLAVAPNFVDVVLTSKWHSCVIYIQLMCINYLFYPMHNANMQAIKAVGKADVSLKLEIIKKIVEVVVLILVFKINVFAIAVGMVCCSTLFVYLNAAPNRRFINYGFGDQIIDILPSLSISVVMAIVVYLIGMVDIPQVMLLIIQVFIGGIVYALLALATKNNEFIYIIKKLNLGK